MKLFLLGLLSLAATHATAGDLQGSHSSSLAPQYCQSQTSGYSTAQNYGHPQTNCNIAVNNSKSAALHACYVAGHSECYVVHASITSSSPYACSAEAFARASHKSMCRPERTFVRHAWAQHYGSEYQNCRVSKNSSSNAALNDCYRSGFRNCKVMNEHILRVDSNVSCETGSVVRAIN